MTNDLKRLRTSERFPLHAMAFKALEEWIASGRFKPGEKLPSEDELSEMLGISRSTLREALGNLETHGLISRRQGVGTFVTRPFSGGVLGGLERLEPFRRVSNEAGVTPKVVERHVGTLAASAKVAGMLGIEDGTTLVRVQVVEAIDGCQCMYVDSHILLRVASAEALQRFEGSELDFLLELASPPLASTRSEIFAIGADGEVSARLGILAGTPVLHLVETYFSDDRTALGIAFVYFLSEHFHFYINRRVVRRRGVIRINP